MDYVYSIAEDTVNGIANLDALKLEVAASGIGTVLQGIKAQADVLTFVFASELAAAELSTLNTVVAAHTGAAPIATVTLEFQYGDERYQVSAVKVETTSYPEPDDVIVVDDGIP